MSSTYYLLNAENNPVETEILETEVQDESTIADIFESSTSVQSTDSIITEDSGILPSTDQPDTIASETGE